MAIADRKITDEQITTYGVVSQPDVLSGTPAANKAVFDKLIRDSIKANYNGLIDALTSTTGANEIGAQVTGITGQTVQLILSALKVLVDDCYTKAESDTILGTNTNTLLANVALDDAGVWTFTRKDGTTVIYDTKLEKIAVNFTLDGDYLVLHHDDGTADRVSIAAFRDHHQFADSDTISWSYTGDENNRTFTATIRPNSITLEVLAVDAVTEIQTNATAAQQSAAAAQASKDAAAASANTAQAGANTATSKASEASTNAVLSQSYAKGGTGTRTGEDTDNAKFYKEQTAQASSTAVAAAQTAASEANRAKSEADRAAEIVGGDYATRTELETGLAGKVDVVTGKGLSTNDYTTEEKTKLTGIAENANNYVHPATHSAQMIDETDTRKFVTPAEKAAWNGKAEKSVTYTITLTAAGWQGAAAPYTQTVAVAGILVTDTPHYTAVYSGTNDQKIAQQEAWSMVSEDSTANGSITFVCFEDKPEVDLALQLEVIR
ncbi:hypothetical protein [Anaerotruncus rubiinfantis]|uniref:hypothetical protein n=1 Tax=Anaerotruncus rubiinfantis TaxID=1720200 RepID=UPI0034A417C0